ncbi:MAG: hypothetical protein ACR2PR_06035 [Pseudohongiellaceae bacterium]
MPARKRFTGDASFTPVQIADGTRANTAFAKLFGQINDDALRRIDEDIAAQSLEEGRQAGAGQTDLELPTSNTTRAKNFRAGALQSMGAALKADVVAEADRILFENPDDMAGAKVALDKAQETFLEETAPELRPAIIEQWTIAADKVQGTVQQNAFKKARKEQLDDFNAGLQSTTEQASEAFSQGDETEAALRTQEYVEILQGMVNSEHITQGEAQERFNKWKQEREVDQVFGEFMENGGREDEASAEAIMQNFIRNPPKNLTREQFNSAAAQMNKQVSRLKVDNQLKKSDFTGQVNDAVFVLKRGQMPENFDDLRSSVIEFPDLVQKLDFARRNSDVISAFRDVGPVQQSFLITSMKADGQKTREDIELLEALETEHSQTMTALKEDPVTLLADTGEFIPPLNVNDADALKERKVIAEKVHAKFGRRSSGFTKAEIGEVINVVDQNSPAENVQLMQNFQANLGDQVTSELMAKVAPENPEFAVAAGVSNEVPKVSIDILQGQQLLRENPGGAPPAADVNLAMNNIYGAALPSEVRAQIAKSGVALNALRQQREGEFGKDQFNSRDFEKALTDITGEVIEHNNEKIIVPVRGMTENQFEDVLESFDETALNKQGFTPTTLDGTEVTMEMVREDARLISVGDGIYLIHLGDGLVGTPDGNAFEWDVRTLARDSGP